MERPHERIALHTSMRDFYSLVIRLRGLLNGAFPALALVVMCSEGTLRGQSTAAKTEPQARSDLKSRVQLFVQPIQLYHRKVQQLFQPLNDLQSANQFQYVLRQIDQNRERWLIEGTKLNDSQAKAQIKDEISLFRKKLESGELGADGQELAAKIASLVKELDDSERLLNSSLRLLEDAGGINTAINSILDPIQKISGQEDANQFALKFARDRIIKGGFAISIEQPQRPQPAKTSIAQVPTSATNQSATSSVDTVAKSGNSTIEAVVRSFFQAIESRNFEGVNRVLDDPIRYYQTKPMPKSEALADIKADWKRYSNWHGVLSKFQSAEPHTCTFELSYTLLEGERPRSATLQCAVSLNQNPPHLINKIEAKLVKSGASPVASEDPNDSTKTQPSWSGRRYRIYNASSQTPVLLKRNPNPASDTVGRILNTTTGIIPTGEPTGANQDWLPVRIGNLTGFVAVENLSLMDAPKFVAIPPGKVEKAWLQAISKYPDLAEAGTSAQEQFSVSVQAAKTAQTELFRNPNWPMIIADQVYSSRQTANKNANSAQPTSWASDSGFVELQQKAESLYKALTTQFAKSPLTAKLWQEQTDWINKRNAFVSSQPESNQRALAEQMTSHRVKQLEGLLQLVSRTDPSWKTFPPDKLPTGRSITIEQATTLRGLTGEGPLYLTGKFTVTATDRNRVVLRSETSDPRTPSARVVVEYPAGASIPPQGAIVTRERNNGYEIQEIRRGNDGQCNIFAREIVGRVVRGFLGIGLQDLDESLRKEFHVEAGGGAVINEVRPGSPAAKAGLTEYDVITSVNDKRIEGYKQLQATIATLQPGTPVKLNLIRNKKPMSISVVVGERPESQTGAAAPLPARDPDVLDGVTVADLNRATRQEFQIPSEMKGALVTVVAPDSIAAASGLGQGDVIQEINRRPISSADDAVKLSEGLSKDRQVLLRVYSKGFSRMLMLESKP